LIWGAIWHFHETVYNKWKIVIVALTIFFTVISASLNSHYAHSIDISWHSWCFFVRKESSQGVFVLMNQSNHHQGTKLQGFMYLCNILVFVIW